MIRAKDGLPYFTDAERKPALWAISVMLAPIVALVLSTRNTSILHELGHAIVGWGQIVSDHRTIITFDWYGTNIAGAAFPMFLYAAAGYWTRRWFPAAWAVGGILPWFIDGFEYGAPWQSFGGGALDYYYHQPEYMIGLVLWLAFCLWYAYRPWRLPKYRYVVDVKGNTIHKTRRENRCPTSTHQASSHS